MLPFPRTNRSLFTPGICVSLVDSCVPHGWKRALSTSSTAPPHHISAAGFGTMTCSNAAIGSARPASSFLRPAHSPRPLPWLRNMQCSFENAFAPMCFLLLSLQLSMSRSQLHPSACRCLFHASGVMVGNQTTLPSPGPFDVRTSQCTTRRGQSGSSISQANPSQVWSCGRKGTQTFGPPVCENELVSKLATLATPSRRHRGGTPVQDMDGK